MEDQASKPSEYLAQQLRRWRDERKLSVQALADRVAASGGTLSRVAISKIENGDRGVSLDEWLQLAHALAVPPPLLFLDLASGAPVAITPELKLHPWLVWNWVTGEQPPHLGTPDGDVRPVRVEEFTRAKTTVFLYRHEERASKDVETAERALLRAEYAGDAAAAAEARTGQAEALRDLATALDDMVTLGVTPPAEPARWIETIRALKLSKYPDQLVVVEVAADGGSDQED